MDFNFNEKYKDASLLMRYASIVFNSGKAKEEYGKKLVKLANQLKFEAYPLILVNSDKTKNGSIAKVIQPNLTSVNSEKLVLEMNQKDSHFIDSIGLSDIEKESENILKAFENFYLKGNFEKLNRAAYRFLKRIKGANEYDVNDGVIRYMISCICMNDFNDCFTIIETLSQNYNLFDYNIYLFILYLAKGNYEKASKYIIKILTNISEDIYEYFTEDDLAFYFSFCLLLNFKTSIYKEILSNNDTLVYKMYDKYPNYFGIVDDYYRCDYLKVNSEFCKILENRINKDPFLAGFSNIIEESLKRRALKEVLSFTTEADYNTLKKLLQIKDNESLKKMLKHLIKYDKIPAVIDDISSTVIMKEKNPIDDCVERSNEIVKGNIKNLINFTLNRNIKQKISYKQLLSSHDPHISKIDGGISAYGEDFEEE